MNLAEKIQAVKDNVEAHRRWLHAHPEYSGQEKETAAYIAKALRNLGLAPQENVGGYGVVALIEGKYTVEIAVEKPEYMLYNCSTSEYMAITAVVEYIPSTTLATLVLNWFTMD